MTLQPTEPPGQGRNLKTLLIMKDYGGRDFIKMSLDMAKPSLNSKLEPASVPGSDGSSLTQIAESVGGLKGKCNT